MAVGRSGGGGGSSSHDASNIHSMLRQPPVSTEGGTLGLPPPPPAPSSASPPMATASGTSTAATMPKRSYFSAGSDGISGSGGSRGSLSLSGGSGSGRASLGLGSSGSASRSGSGVVGGNRRFGPSRYGRYGDAADDDAVLGAADAVLATSPMIRVQQNPAIPTNSSSSSPTTTGIAASKVELSSYFAAEAGQQQGQGIGGGIMTPGLTTVGLEGLSLGEMENDENHCMHGANSDMPAVDTERRIVNKKPFLRKGSRKEPSSLHRFQVIASNTAAAASPSDEVDNAGMDGRPLLPPPSSATSLEALEKMQQDQMDDLERRMARRRDAREMQQRRKKKGPHGNASCSSGGAARTSQYIDSNAAGGSSVALPTRAPYATDEDSPAVLEGSITAGGSAGGSASAPTTSCQNKLQLGQRSGGKTAGSNSKRKAVGGRMPLQAAGKNVVTSSGSTDPAQLLAQQQRNDEQWSLLKSMRRRQEAALRDAEQERETVRSWAASEKESVTKWANEQRSLIRKERHRASTATLASHRERQKEERQQLEAYKELEKSSQEEIATLRMTVEKLRTETEGAKAKYRMSERKLRDKIKSQNEIIRQLKSEIGSPIQSHSQQTSVSSFNRHGITSSTSSSNTPPTVAFGSTLPREKKPRSFGKKKSARTIGTGNRELGDSRGGQSARADVAAAEEIVGELNDNAGDGHGTSIRTDEVELAIVDKTPAEVRQSKPESAAPTPTPQEEKTPAAMMEAPQVEDLVEETTEQWMKRLQERHNTLPIAADGGSAGAGVIPPISATPAPLVKDDLLARANQLLSGGSTGVNSAHRNSMGGNQEPHNASIPQVFGTNHLLPLSVGPRAYPVAQQTPDPHLVASTSVEALGSTEGKRVVSYSNGTTKETLPDGTTRVCFVNGDIKTTYFHQDVTIYYYAAAETTHTTHPDGVEVFQFANKQTEKHFPDGRKEVYFVDGTIKMINADGSSETTFPDGVRIVEMANGTKQIIRG
jgi:hypothetical protein